MPHLVTAVANQKGGVGKTTTAINLAACLAETGRRVLLIDLDPQANATSGLNVRPHSGASIYRVLLGEESIASKIQGTGVKNLDLIPSEMDLAGAEVDIARGEDYLIRFQKALAPLREGNCYAEIVVDCPPSLGILTVNALAAADSVVVPIQCEYYALEGLSVINHIIQQMSRGGVNPALELEGIVMTMYDGRTNLSQQVVNEVRSHFKEKVYQTVIPRTVRLSEAPSFGQPIIQYDGRSSGAEAYRALTREFIQRRTAAAHPPAQAVQPLPDTVPAGPQAADG